ncbi:hypothetical protein [Nicoliella lavandulae]|uniref:Uncharacterized protein n=1 Tax=Nicoliella lavandulae TaxID=3082954 RepID=A0ABU8SMC8_9LACO
MTDDFNYLLLKIKELQKINNSHIYIGVPYDDDHMTMIGLVNEYGTQIQAKPGKWLCIPMVGAQGKKPSEIPHLYKRGNSLGVNDSTQPNGYRLCFVLRKSVKIPSRPFIRHTLSHSIGDWTDMIQYCLQRVLSERLYSADDFFKDVGTRMVKDMQKTIKDMTEPANASLTIANKGKDDPLVDTGKLMKSIMYVVEHK